MRRAGAEVVAVGSLDLVLVLGAGRGGLKAGAFVRLEGAVVEALGGIVYGRGSL